MSFNKILYFLPLIIIFGLILWAATQSPFTIFPGNREFITFTDEPSGGNSVIREFYHTPERLKLTFFLGAKESYPYVGISIKTPLELSAYTHLKLKLKSNAHLLTVTICHKLHGYNSEEELYNYLFKEHHSPFSRELTERIIPLKAFIVDQWWYSYHREVTTALPPHNKKTADFLFVRAGDYYAYEKEQEMVIEEISLFRNFTPLYWGIAIFLLLYYGILILKARWGSPFLELKNSPLSYVKVSPPLELRDSHEWDRVITYLHTNLTDPELSRDSAARALGLSPKKLSNLLMEQEQKGFKQYVNDIRLKEAKRLLIESDRKILEIAFALGYNNQTHFNRVFKADCHLSPGEFRRKNRH